MGPLYHITEYEERIAALSECKRLLRPGGLLFAAALRTELAAGGFPDADIHGVMGGAWLAHDLDTLWDDPACRETLMKTVRMLDGHEEIIGLSGHLLGICKT